MDLGIKGKNALITGGSRGIGAAIAKEMASNGANIIIVDINDKDYQETLSKELDKYGVKHAFYNMNVADSQSVKDAVKKIKNDFGTIDILVNNAGITRDNLLIRMKEEDWDAVLTVNLKGAFLVSKEVAPIMMKQRWGRIVNIASVVGLMGNAGQTNYSASKAGLIGFTKSLAREVAPRGVTVNAVAPGFIVSKMTDALPEKVREQFLSLIPIGRFADPSEVADLVTFLASEKAKYITGEVVSINGGMYM